MEKTNIIQSIKAVTIWQPWATLIILLEKLNETRSWPTNHRGPLAIHAAQCLDREACETEPIKSILTKHGYSADTLPTGAILGTATIAGMWKSWDVERKRLILAEPASEEGTIYKEITDQEFALGDYCEGRYAWELRDVHRFAEPIPAKGKQRLWNW